MSDEQINKTFIEYNREQGYVKIKEATKRGFAIGNKGDSINIGQMSSKTRRGRVGHKRANTLLTGNEQVVIDDVGVRKITPRETWRLQGFTDEQFDKAQTSGLSDTQLYKQGGNSVSIPVIEHIAKQLR